MMIDMMWLIIGCIVAHPFISLARWKRCQGLIIRRERFYWIYSPFKSSWTPFVRPTKRFSTWLGYFRDTEKVYNKQHGHQ